MRTPSVHPRSALGVSVSAGVAIALLAGCGGRQSEGPRVITGAGPMPPAEWSAAERAKPIAARLLRATDQSSTFLIRLTGAEAPHTHDQHDVTVVMLSGAGILHIGQRAESIRPGDVMEIPHGVTHWAENTDPAGSVVYAVFTPPYDGTDMHPVGSRQF